MIGAAGRGSPPTAQIPTAIGHQIPRAGETEIPDDQKVAGGGKSETSRRRDNLNLAGCGARNIARRSRSARNPLRAQSLFREAATPEPEIAKPAEAAGLPYPASREDLVSGMRELPRSRRIFASPFGLPRAKCALAGRFRAGCAATPEAPLLSISAVLPGFPRKPAPPGQSGATASPAPCDSRRCPASSAAKLWHAARRWDRETRQPGPARRHHRPHRARRCSTCSLFDFQNYRTGRLDPSPRHDRREGRLLPPHRRRCARPAAGSRAADLAAPVRGGPRRRRPVPVAAAHQRLRAAAAVAMARLSRQRPAAAVSRHAGRA